ncbi:MAG: PDDEXK nuclease domain-containing protein [Accumulibacter sp.]|jgi:predicted nuclease of restriction endonuclease-like (RecB) superfamily|uniref:PDDEXK nuclease domain-containing protein n=1 Tax=Accumulibacter sp. TaxID=2053492 RepID=UPI002FC2757B
MSTTPPAAAALSFERLVTTIGNAHARLAAQASRAVNTSLTLRNWLIGLYITEYEQQGSDRAQYGDTLIERLSERLMVAGVSRAEARELRRYRQFYLSYPQIRETLTPELGVALLPQTNFGNNRESPTPGFGVAAGDVLSRLSFSHIVELLQCDDTTKRAFYELECIRGNWSVRELKRQIASLYYERSGLSTDKAKLAALAQEDAERAEPTLTIRDPYVFEFLGLKPQEVMSESHLEDQLLNKLHDFLLELGHGFCFEARQKRILIGDSHNFVDLVFYHRILKCHVLLELKIAAFSHENIGQLNTYVSWYRKNMMTAGDNPPVGILLCTQKDHALVEYALAGIDNGLFVSKYLLELPKKEEMQRFIEQQLAAGVLGETSAGQIPAGKPGPAGGEH